MIYWEIKLDGQRVPRRFNSWLEMMETLPKIVELMKERPSFALHIERKEESDVA